MCSIARIIPIIIIFFFVLIIIPQISALESSQSPLFSSIINDKRASSENSNVTPLYCDPSKFLRPIELTEKLALLSGDSIEFKFMLNGTVVYLTPLLSNTYNYTECNPIPLTISLQPSHFTKFLMVPMSVLDPTLSNQIYEENLSANTLIFNVDPSLSSPKLVATIQLLHIYSGRLLGIRLCKEGDSDDICKGSEQKEQQIPVLMPSSFDPAVCPNYDVKRDYDTIWDLNNHNIPLPTFQSLVNTLNTQEEEQNSQFTSNATNTNTTNAETSPSNSTFPNENLNYDLIQENLNKFPNTTGIPLPQYANLGERVQGRTGFMPLSHEDEDELNTPKPQKIQNQSDLSYIERYYQSEVNKYNHDNIKPQDNKSQIHPTQDVTKNPLTVLDKWSIQQKSFNIAMKLLQHFPHRYKQSSSSNQQFPASYPNHNIKTLQLDLTPTLNNFSMVQESFNGLLKGDLLNNVPFLNSKDSDSNSDPFSSIWRGAGDMVNSVFDGTGNMANTVADNASFNRTDNLSEARQEDAFSTLQQASLANLLNNNPILGSLQSLRNVASNMTKETPDVSFITLRSRPNALLTEATKPLYNPCRGVITTSLPTSNNTNSDDSLELNSTYIKNIFRVLKLNKHIDSSLHSNGVNLDNICSDCEICVTNSDMAVLKVSSLSLNYTDNDLSDLSQSINVLSLCETVIHNIQLVYDHYHHRIDEILEDQDNYFSVISTLVKGNTNSHFCSHYILHDEHYELFGEAHNAVNHDTLLLINNSTISLHHALEHHLSFSNKTKIDGSILENMVRLFSTHILNPMLQLTLHPPTQKRGDITPFIQRAMQLNKKHKHAVLNKSRPTMAKNDDSVDDSSWFSKLLSFIQPAFTPSTFKSDNPSIFQPQQHSPPELVKNVVETRRSLSPKKNCSHDGANIISGSLVGNFNPNNMFLMHNPIYALDSSKKHPNTEPSHVSTQFHTMSNTHGKNNVYCDDLVKISDPTEGPIKCPQSNIKDNNLKDYQSSSIFLQFHTNIRSSHFKLFNTQPFMTDIPPNYQNSRKLRLFSSLFQTTNDDEITSLTDEPPSFNSNTTQKACTLTVNTTNYRIGCVLTSLTYPEPYNISSFISNTSPEVSTEELHTLNSPIYSKNPTAAILSKPNPHNFATFQSGSSTKQSSQVDQGTLFALQRAGDGDRTAPLSSFWVSETMSDLNYSMDYAALNTYPMYIAQLAARNYAPFENFVSVRGAKRVFMGSIFRFTIGFKSFWTAIFNNPPAISLGPLISIWNFATAPIRALLVGLNITQPGAFVMNSTASIFPTLYSQQLIFLWAHQSTHTEDWETTVSYTLTCPPLAHVLGRAIAHIGRNNVPFDLQVTRNVFIPAGVYGTTTGALVSYDYTVPGIYEGANLSNTEYLVDIV